MHDTPLQPVQPGTSSTAVRRRDPTVLGIVAVLAAYALAALAGWPQHGRDLLVAGQAAHGHDDHGTRQPADGEGPNDVHHAVDPAHEPRGASTAGPQAPPPWTVIPFVALLAAIAVLPLAPGPLAHWWEHNSSKFLVSAALALATLAAYAFVLRLPVDVHFPAHAVATPPATGPAWAPAGALLVNALCAEYIPFIALLFALYCITGGVRIEGDLAATPAVNTAFIAVGGAAASFVGTTGAAMLLIRPLLETNRERRLVAHTVVFFIFVVCNCGGCLLPIGDPPLFLGYLQGVDFFWTLSLWKPWLATNGILLAIYWAWDAFLAHPRERASDIARDERSAGRLRISGLGLNAPLMAGVIAAVALLDPSKAVPGTEWHPWIFLREAVLLGLVALSLGLGSTGIRQRNGFTFFAILEVAALFVGIFICMQPALALLDVHGAALGIDSPQAFFWATGSLSSVLDNAPTYLVFFKTAQAMPAEGPTMAGVEVGRLAAISLGAVFLGAMTYIGNGPNFMVKAIAEQAGVRMPSFFGYVLYSLGVLLPVFALVAVIFL